MDVRAKRALLALVLWTLMECQAEPQQRTVASIKDLLFSPSSQQYSIYILPDAQHGENLRKRQIDFQDQVDDEEPLPEPEPNKKVDENRIQRDSRNIIAAQDPSQDPRYIQHGSTNSFISNIPRPSGQYSQGDTGKVNQVFVNNQGNNVRLPPFNSGNQQPNFQHTSEIVYEAPKPTQNTPFFITTFEPESQTGFSYATELPDNMNTYANLDGSLHHSSQTAEPPVLEPTTQAIYETSYDSYEPITEYYVQESDKAKLTKKFMDKPKKVMKVIKASPDGEYIPQEVPGVMLKTISGEEEAFVPADLLEDTEKLLTSASAQQPAFVRPDQQISGQGPRGMPYQFGYIVDDEATANFQTRQETGDINGVVTGCYQVLDPTGLVRTVVYRADSEGFRILSLSRGPDKTPCPGLDDATRSPIPSQAPTPRPQQPRPTFANVGGFSNNNQFNSQSSNQFSSQSSNKFSSESSSQNSNQFNSQKNNQFNNQNNNQNSLSQSSISSSSSSKESSSSSSQSSQSSQFSGFSGKNGLFEQPSVAKTIAPQPLPPSHTANQYGTAQQAWMAEYLQNITNNLYNSFTNSTTFTNTNTYGAGGSKNGLVNFPFVLIPITTFLDLQKSGAIGNDVQSYGAFIQPGQTQSQLSQALQQQQLQRQQQEQQRQKTITETTKHTVFNTYNSSKAETQQKAFNAQGVNTVNYQINGAQKQGGQAGYQGHQQQYQSQQSSQSAKSSKESSSSSSSNLQSSFTGNQGFGGGAHHGTQQQYQNQQSSQSSKSSKESSSSSNSNLQSSFTGNQGFGGGAKQAIQQQYQNQQSSQSSKSAQASQSSSSSFNSNFQGNFAGNQGLQPTFQGNQVAQSPSSYGSKPNPGVPGISYGAPPPSPPKPTIPKPTPQPYVQPRPTLQTYVQPRPSIPQQTTPQLSQYGPTPSGPIQPQQIQNFAQPSINNGASASFSSQKSQSSQQSKASDSKQSFSSSSKFGNGLASQNFQSSSSKSDESSESSKSSSSNQFSFNGAGGNAGSQHSSSSKSSSLQSSSASSSSSQKSFNSFSAGGIANGQNFLPTHLTQGFAGFPEPKPSSSSLSPTFVASSPASVNYLPKSVADKPVTHQSYQEATNPIILEAPHTIVTPQYISSGNPSDDEFSVLAPAPEPESVSMEGWVPLTNHFNSRSTENPTGEYIQNSQPAAPSPIFNQYQQNNPAALQGGGNSFHFSSSNESSQKESSSEQNHQQFSSSWSNTGGGVVNPRQLYSRDTQKADAAVPSQKQPRHLLPSQIYQNSAWTVQQHGR